MERRFQISSNKINYLSRSSMFRHWIIRDPKFWPNFSPRFCPLRRSNDSRSRQLARVSSNLHDRGGIYSFPKEIDRR